MLKIRPYKILIYLMMIYTLTTLTYTLWPISSPNKIVGFLIFFNVLWVCFRYMNRKKMMLLMGSLGIIVWSILQSSDIFSYLSDGIYLLITIFLLIEMNNDYFADQILLALEQSQNFIKGMVILCDFFLCIGFFDARCYDSSQWDGSYYVGYTNASHTLAAGACLLLVFSLYIIRNKRNIVSFLYFVPSIVAILKSGARTFLIPIVIVCLFFYIYHIKNFSLKLLIFPTAIIAAVYVFLNSSMIEKFTFSANNQFTDMNFIGRFTNGRTAFWVVDLLAFDKYNIFQKMFGNGFDYVYCVNEKNFNLAIWAHNDIINCLLSVGLIGTFIYLYVAYKVCKKIVNQRKHNLIKILLLTYMIVPALLNGFYTYQHYFYSFFILTILYEKYYCRDGLRGKNK